MKAGIGLPKTVDDVDEEVAPKVLVEVPPNIDPPVGAPKAVTLSNGLEGNGLLPGLWLWPNIDGDPNVDDCIESAIRTKHIYYIVC